MLLDKNKKAVYTKVIRLLCLFFAGMYKSGPGSFLFSLRNSDNLTPFKAPLKNENDVNAIRGGYGPTFGGGHDLHISSSAGSNANSHARKFGFDYQSPPGYTLGQGGTPFLLAGSGHFTPSEFEVLYLN
jgi:hypothetical protein